LQQQLFHPQLHWFQLPQLFGHEYWVDPLAYAAPKPASEITTTAKMIIRFLFDTQTSFSKYFQFNNPN
jgi:hypothetical protein